MASRASVTGWRKFGVATSVPSRTRSCDRGRGGQHGHRGVPRTVGHAAPADVVVGPRRGEPGPSAHSHWRRASLHRSLGRMTRPTRTKPTVGGYRCRRGQRGGGEALEPRPLGHRVAQSGAADERRLAVPARGGRRTARPEGLRHRLRWRCAHASPWPSAWHPEGRWSGSTSRDRLLQLARRRAAEAGATNARFVEVDMQTGAVGPEPFDVAVSQFGVMFFDEPLAAFAAVRRRAGAGGRLVFACWPDVERNPWHVGTALRPLLPPPPLPAPGKSPVGPFAFGDDEYVRDLLEGAGFGASRARAHEIDGAGPGRARSSTVRFSPSWGCRPSAKTRRWPGRAPSGPVRGRPGRLRVPAELPDLRGRQRRGGARSRMRSQGPVAGYSGTPLPEEARHRRGIDRGTARRAARPFRRAAARRDREAAGPRQADVVVAFFTERRELRATHRGAGAG